MKKFSTALFYYHRRLIKRCRQNPRRYLRIDEGKQHSCAQLDTSGHYVYSVLWKDNEQNFDDIQGSMKDDKKL